MRRSLVVSISLVIGALTLSFCATPPCLAQSSGGLDQVFEPDLSDGFILGAIQNTADHELSKAQSFTVGQDGSLASVDILLSVINLGAASVIVEIQATSAGVPDGDVLSSVTIPRSEVPNEPTYLNVDLTAAEIPVAVGDILAIVVRSEFRSGGTPDSDYTLYGEFGGDATYPGGFASSALNGVWAGIQNADFGFRTYVDSPPTPTIAISWGEIKHRHLLP